MFVFFVNDCGSTFEVDERRIWDGGEIRKIVRAFPGRKENCENIPCLTPHPPLPVLLGYEVGEVEA